MSIARIAAVMIIVSYAMLLSVVVGQDPKNAPPALPAAGTDVEYLDPRGALKKGKFVELAPNGAVRVRIEDGSTRLFPPNRVRLPQGAANQPASVPAGVKPAEGNPPAATETPAARVWTDASGQFKIEAEFLGVQDGQVQLKKTDGKVIKLALDKLSAADQAIAKSMAGAAPAPAASADNPSPATASATPASARPDLQSTAVSPFPPLTWKGVADPGPVIAADFGAAFRPPQVGKLLVGTDEQPRGLLLHHGKQQAWIGTTQTTSENRNTYFISRFNLATGEALPRLAAAHALQPMAFDPAGEQLVALNQKDPLRDKYTLDIYSIKDDLLTLVRSFTPYADPRNPGTASVVRYAEFIDANHLVTIGGSNILVMWDLQTLKPVYTLNTGIINVHCCLSPGRRQLAVSTGNGVYLLDSLTGQNLGKFDQGNERDVLQQFAGLAFNAEGSLLAAAKPAGIWVWQVQDGRIYKSHEGLSLRTGAGCPVAFSQVPGHLVFGENWVFDYEQGIMAGQYSGNQQYGQASLGGKHWFVSRWVDAQTAEFAYGLLQYEFPTADVIDKVKATTDEELLAIKPGSRIALSLPPQTDAKTAETIRAGLSETLLEKGWTLTAAGEAGDFTLACSALPNPNQEIHYRSSGATPRVEKTTRVYLRGHMKLTRTGDTKPIWEHVIMWGPPNFIQLKEGQSLDDALRHPPFTEYFSRPAIPQRLPKYPHESLANVIFTHEGTKFFKVP